MCEISILFLGSQLCSVVLYEKVFVKLKVIVMQVPKAIKGGSTRTAALNVINCVSGLWVFHGESGGMSIWGLFFLFLFYAVSLKRMHVLVNLQCFF